MSEPGSVAGRVNALIADGLAVADGTERDKRTGVHVQKIKPVLAPVQSELPL